MRMKRICCRALVVMMLLGSLCIHAWAIVPANTFSLIQTRASGHFTVEIEANSTAKSTSDFPLSAGETVRIDAIFSPEGANLDVGLIAPDGYYYYLNINGGGDIDKTIRVDDRGNYTLQIRNNSDAPVVVTGFVYY